MKKTKVRKEKDKEKVKVKVMEKVEGKGKGRGFFCIGIMVVVLLCLSSSLALSSPPKEKINILTTLFPLYEFAQAVCGDKGEVDILLPPGSEVHTWKPKPSDILKISQADLFIVVGSVLEPWLEDILKSVKNPKLHILDTSLKFIWKEKGVEEENEHAGENDSHDHDAKDPHIWLDFDYDMQIIEQISSVLSQIDSENRDYYSSNANAINLRLKELDNLYTQELKRCLLRTFIMGGHSAFGYIARKYDLIQVAVYGLNPDSLPSPKKLVETIQIAQEQGVKAIYYEALHRGEMAQMIADEVGCPILPLNPGANLSRKELQSGMSFFDIMIKNLENLKIGLIYK